VGERMTMQGFLDRNERDWASQDLSQYLKTKRAETGTHCPRWWAVCSRFRRVVGTMAARMSGMTPVAPKDGRSTADDSGWAGQARAKHPDDYVRSHVICNPGCLAHTTILSADDYG
jgi:hypothetical protein